MIALLLALLLPLSTLCMEENAPPPQNETTEVPAFIPPTINNDYDDDDEKACEDLYCWLALLCVSSGDLNG